MTPQQLPSPSDWQEFKLGELMKFSNGINADKSAYGSGVPFANVLEVINNECLEEDDIPGRINLPQKILNRYEVRRGDFLFNRTSETQEEVGLASVYLGNEPIVFGGFVFRGRHLTNNLDLGYSKYALRTSGVRDQITARGQGGIRANIGQGDLKTVTVTLPTIPEQRVIAEALDDASSQIKLLERLIAKKQAIKQGIMQQLLSGRTRLSGFTEQWRECRLGDFGKCLRGVGYDPSHDLSESDHSFTIRLLRANNVQDDLITHTNLQYVHERRVKVDQVLRPGDVVICMANGSRALVGKSALFESAATGLRYTFGAFMGAFRVVDAAASPRYIAGILHTYAFRAWLDVILSGSSINNLRPGDVEDFVCLIPDMREQQAIVQVLSDSEAELAVLRERLCKAREVKQGLMQQLLTGRTRLPVPEATL